MQKNKNFQSDEHVDKYNKERERTAKLLIILIVIVNIILFNINSFNKKNLSEKENESYDNKETIDIKQGRNNNKKMEDLNLVSKVLYESRAYDFSLEEGNLYFKLSGAYSDNFILELSKDNKFSIENVIYNDYEDYIEVRGRLL